MGGCASFLHALGVSQILVLVHHRRETERAFELEVSTAEHPIHIRMLSTLHVGKLVTLKGVINKASVIQCRAVSVVCSHPTGYDLRVQQMEKGARG
jgi:DNA replicative helicase MCM subunit Mcm2 (Cdc46/Mcm family)